MFADCDHGTTCKMTELRRLHLFNDTLIDDGDEAKRDEKKTILWKLLWSYVVTDLQDLRATVRPLYVV